MDWLVIGVGAYVALVLTFIYALCRAAGWGDGRD